MKKTSHGFLSPCQKLEKTNDQIPRNLPDRHTDVKMDRHYFIGPFRPQLGVQ